MTDLTPVTDSRSMLTNLITAESMLAEIATARDADEVARFAEAMRVIARQLKLGLSSINHATAIKLRAEIKLARLVDEEREAGRIAVRGVKGRDRSTDSDDLPTLADLGLSQPRVSEAGILARNYDEDAIIRAAVEATDTDRVLSRDRLLRSAGRWGGTDRDPRSFPVADESLGIRPGDFRWVLEDIPDDSVDLVLTDPPYAREHLNLWSDLGGLAARILRPGGSLVAYSGHVTLFDAHARLEAAGLRYWWTLALWHRHGRQIVQSHNVSAGWKPVLWFVKDHRGSSDLVADVLDGSAPRKVEHAWGQGVDEILPVIETLSRPNELVVDPMAGSGTVSLACRAAGRRFIGAEITVDDVTIDDDED